MGCCDPESHVIRTGGLISHQFLFTAAGSGVLVVDGKEYPQKSGSVFYLAPGKPHEYRPVSGSWETRWLVFRGEYCESLMKGLGFEEFACAEDCNTAEMEKIFGKILSAAGDPINGGEETSLLIYEFILAARRAMFFPDRTESGKSDIAEKAIRYIDRNYMQDIALETLAALSGVTVQHFCRVFRAKTLIRPLEYIARRRIAAAKALLTDTAYEIGEVGRMVGYPDRNYFSIVFRKNEGISPREYRRNKGAAKM
ncbi:MAG: AraC family transcriptional regulator [Ruminiclostridium sp.]